MGSHSVRRDTIGCAAQRPRATDPRASHRGYLRGRACTVGVRRGPGGAWRSRRSYTSRSLTHDAKSTMRGRSHPARGRAGGAPPQVGEELLRAARAGRLDAVSRLRDALGDVPDELRLADAQRAIAREHGHRSWAAFRRNLEQQADERVHSVSAAIRAGTAKRRSAERVRRDARAMLVLSARVPVSRSRRRRTPGSPRGCQSA
jgi:hypothetical protein